MVIGEDAVEGGCTAWGAGWRRAAGRDPAPHPYSDVVTGPGRSRSAS
jgi:hypothetical protein